jgi:hypothetical protein
MLAAAADALARKHEARAALLEAAPKMAALAARTRRAKAAVEAELGRQFGGRRVNVLGEINQTLAACGGGA